MAAYSLREQRHFMDQWAERHYQLQSLKSHRPVDKKGYYLLGADGAVYAFGDAQYVGGLNGGSIYNKIAYTGNVIGMAAHNGGGLLDHDVRR